MFKAQPAVADDMLHILTNNSWISETFPDEWKGAISSKFPKRVIYETSIIGVEFVCSQRLQKTHVYPTIDEAQIGFRPESSCADHNMDLHHLFIDFERVFDNIHRKMLCLHKGKLPE